MTPIGPVDILCKDSAGRTVAIEIKRRGEIDGVEQLTRYLELMNRDPHLAPVTGVFAAQVIAAAGPHPRRGSRDQVRGARLRRAQGASTTASTVSSETGHSEQGTGPPSAGDQPAQHNHSDQQQKRLHRSRATGESEDSSDGAPEKHRHQPGPHRGRAPVRLSRGQRIANLTRTPCSPTRAR